MDLVPVGDADIRKRLRLLKRDLGRASAEARKGAPLNALFDVLEVLIGLCVVDEWIDGIDHDSPRHQH